MDETLTFINSYVLPHWPFFSALLFFMIIGQVLVKNVFTKEASLSNKPLWFWWWGRKTLPLHPIILGLLLGLMWTNPEPGIVNGVPCMAYFATAGGLSVWVYEFIKGIAKKKGINIDLLGVDSNGVSSIEPPKVITIIPEKNKK
jgi:hypothetical protein